MGLLEKATGCLLLYTPGADFLSDIGMSEIMNFPLFATIGRMNGRWPWAAKKRGLPDQKAGSDRVAAVYSVVENTKLNGLEPQAYIADVTAKIAGKWPAARGDELMPWNWRPDQQPIAAAA